MEKKKFFTTKTICIIGVMTALVFVMTFLGIDVPTVIGKCKIHFGNIMCLLSSLLFGPMTGALAAGFGSALYDLQDPSWAPEFWVTFINKFTMSFVAGLLMHKVRIGKPAVRVWFAGIGGILAYCVVYAVKNIFYSGMFIQGFTLKVAVITFLTAKLPVTLINGVIAVICAGALTIALQPALKKARLL